MRIVFINLSLRPDSKRRQLPVGLAYVMTAVKKAGFDFNLIDMDINNISMQQLESILNASIYDVYALGCIVTGFRYVRQIAEIIKKVNPKGIIVAGNSVATSIPEILLKNTRVDIAVMGEADITIVELLRIIENKGNLDDVEGIVFKHSDKIIYSRKRNVIQELDVVDFPDWDIFDLDEYYKYAHININSFSGDKVLSFPLNSARGCPFSCTFCYHVFKGEKYRKYSGRLVINEIKRLHDKYKSNFISFWDELTFSDIKSVETMVNNLRALDFKIGWEAPVRGNLFKSEHIDLIKSMKEVGCDSISFSLENASPEILKAMNKKMDVSQFIEQANTLWKGGVVPLTSVVIGYPQETPETIKMTIDVCEKCNIYPSVGFLLPLPGTPIYDWAKGNGYITNEVEYLERVGDRQDFHVNLTKMSDSELIETTQKYLEDLAGKMGLKFDSVFKTVTYQKPKASKGK